MRKTTGSIYGLGKLIVLVLLVVGITLVVYDRFFKENKSSFEAKVSEIKTMVRLSSLDIRDEMVITDTVNKKVLTAIVRIKGSISFDVEQLYTYNKGDTLVVQLPPEIIESYESDENRGYEIIDLYGLNMLDDFFGREVKLTSFEENLIKMKAPGVFAQKMYEKGYVKRARANAVETLAKLFALFHDKIMIVDNYPEGYYSRNNYNQEKEERPQIPPSGIKDSLD